MTTYTSSDKPRLSLCCKPGLYLRDSRCYANDSFPAPKIIIPEIYYPNLSISSMRMEDFDPQYRWIDCFFTIVYHLEDPAIYLLENGTVYVNHSINGGNLFEIDNYCMASWMTDNGTENVLSVCPQPRYIEEPRIMIVEGILPILSIPFVLAIFVIHAVIPEMRNTQGHIFRCYLASLLVTFVTTAEITVNPDCHPVISIIAQLSLVASFFWINVMAFDIWWTFRGFERKSSLEDRTKFIVYSFYAWGTPALIFGTGVILDLLHVESTILIRPGISLHCRYTDQTAYDIYFVGPAAATTFLNLYFFISTAVKVKRQKKATAQHLGGTDSQRHDQNRERFNLYLKLFVVMGISRLGSIMAWRYYSQLPDYIWYCLVSEGNLQGPLVFIIYVWKPKTKEMLLSRLGSINNKFRRAISSQKSNQSSSDTDGTTMSEITPS